MSPKSSLKTTPMKRRRLADISHLGKPVIFCLKQLDDEPSPLHTHFQAVPVPQTPLNAPPPAIHHHPDAPTESPHRTTQIPPSPLPITQNAATSPKTIPPFGDLPTATHKPPASHSQDQANAYPHPQTGARSAGAIAKMFALRWRDSRAHRHHCPLSAQAFGKRRARKRVGQQKWLCATSSFL